MRLLTKYPIPEAAGGVIGIGVGIASHHWEPILLIAIGAGLVITVIKIIKDRGRQHRPG